MPFKGTGLVLTSLGLYWHAGITIRLYCTMMQCWISH